MLFKVITKVRFHKLLELLPLAVINLRFVYPTYHATKECMALSTLHFKRKHYNNGQANAFRHALWNYLIALKCSNASKNRSRIIIWTKRITDWHEDAFRNRALAQRMDLHNNGVGRVLFLDDTIANKDAALHYLLELATRSIKINTNSNLADYPLSLVHITDDQ